MNWYRFAEIYGIAMASYALGRADFSGSLGAVYMGFWLAAAAFLFALLNADRQR